MNDYRILVVDDEEDLCEILKFNLENEGYFVDTANSCLLYTSKRPDTKVFEFTSTLSTWKGACTMSVSYTHLDVYKRQL